MEKIEKTEIKKLASEVTEFVLEYSIFNISCEKKELEEKIEEQFEDVVFVEGLINTIIVKTRNRKNIDTGKLIDLLIELEKLRLELEYDVNRRWQKC